MIKRINGLDNFKRGDVNLKAIYRAETLIWPYEIVGDIDTTFNIGTGFDSLVWVADVDDNDKYIIGGHFQNFNGSSANRIVRLNSDGSRDTNFDIGTGFNNIVRNIKFIDNKYLIVGDFTSYKGNTVNRIVRLNLDGTIDTSFNIGTGFNGVASFIKIHNGKYFIGGQFDSYNGTSVNKIVKLNNDGTIDTSFDSNNFTFDTNLVSYAAIIIFGIEVDFNNKIIIVGDFDSNILRLNDDGTKDTFNASFNGTMRIVKLLSDGKLLIGGGGGVIYNGVFTTRGLIRLNNDGSRDTTLNIGNGFGGGGGVLGITVQEFNEKMIVTGTFTSFDAQPFPVVNPPYRRIIRLKYNGDVDNTFDSGQGFNNNAWENILLGDRLLVTGAFTSYDGVTYNRLIKLK